MDNRILKIEKKYCVFCVDAGEFEIEIFGSNFLTAPSFRASGRLTTTHSLQNVL